MKKAAFVITAPQHIINIFTKHGNSNNKYEVSDRNLYFFANRVRYKYGFFIHSSEV